MPKLGITSSWPARMLELRLDFVTKHGELAVLDDFLDTSHYLDTWPC